MYTNSFFLHNKIELLQNQIQKYNFFKLTRKKNQVFYIWLKKLFLGKI